MRLSARQTLKRCLLLVAGTMAGLLAFAGAAQAAVTAAPEITAKPSDPNTTQAKVTFKYAKGAGETSTADPFRFYCRQYPTATPPSSTAGWAACGLSTDAAPPSYSFTPTANQSMTFEVAGRETTAIGTQGPSQTYVWNHDIPAPSNPPTLTAEPDNPNASDNNRFEFASSTADGELVSTFQCRLDSNEESDWSGCRDGYFQMNLANGEHTFDVRSGNVAGWGPATSATWTVDVPDPNPSVSLGSVTSGSWFGPVSNPSSGVGDYAQTQGKTVANVSDQNGDGIDDVALSSRGVGSTETYVDVLYSDALIGKARPLGSETSNEGFRIPVTGTSTATKVDSLGDQNGDGVDEIMIRYVPGPAAAPRIAVVYGGIDTRSLPFCAGSSTVRCFDLISMASDQGYVLTTPTLVPYRFGGNGVLDAGDFNGDGVSDILVRTAQNNTKYYVVSGADRSGVVDVTTLPADQLLTIQSDSGAGAFAWAIGDIDQDGKSDIAVYGSAGGVLQVVYGFDFDGPIQTADLTAEDGFKVYGQPLAPTWLANVGDLNGDGRDDLVGNTSSVLIPDSDSTLNVFYSPARGTDPSFILGPDFDGDGFIINRGSAATTALGFTPSETLGDFNNDGTPDFGASAPATPVGGLVNFGAAYLVFGRDASGETLSLGPDMTSGLAVGLTGRVVGDKAGTSIVSLGDIDGDGIGDQLVGSPVADVDGVSKAGRVDLVLGKSVLAGTSTRNAAAVTNTSALLNASVSTNNRETEVWFEYGTTDEYGQTSEPQEFESSNSGDSAVIGVGGLTKNTTYHYRAVAKNALGLVRYGDDRTFTTTNVTPPDGPSPCLKDPTLPGCADYCKANPTAMGCPDYDWCAANPGKCSSGTAPTKARLTLISTTKKISVKRGKTGVLAVAVVNTGGKAAGGVKVCVKAPKRLVKVKKCVKVGKLGSGKSRIVKVRVKVKPKAKRGKKAVLKLTASGNKLSAKKATAKVVVR